MRRPCAVIASAATQSSSAPRPLDCFVATSHLRGYVEPADAGRSAFDVDAALGSLLAMAPAYRAGNETFIAWRQKSLSEL
jgi:hypothetical protein